MGREPPSGDAPGSVPPGQLTALLKAIAALPEDSGAQAEPPDLEPGTLVGRFRLLRLVGRGGFGVVYEARDGTLPRSVALKMVRRRGWTTLPQERLLLEADAAARLSHPNIVTLHDTGSSEHGPYLVMEMLRGEPLSSVLSRGALPPQEAVRIALQIALGLAHAHARGVVHRDLKPANVFVCADGPVKILDFGLAHALGHVRVDGGTPAFMAPEQRAGAPEDERTDVYALGVMLYQMLTGERPSGGGGGRSMARRARDLDVAQSPALADLVAGMVDRDPVHRPRNGTEVATALAAIQRELDTSPSTPSGPVRKRRRWRLVAGLAAAVAVTAISVRLLWPAAPPPAAPPARMALADVANETGEPELDVSGLLRTILEQSTFLDVIPRSRLLDELRAAGREDVSRIDEELGAEAARRCGATGLVVGRLLRFGSRYVMEVRVVDPGSDARRFSFRDQEDSRERLPELIDRVGEQVRLLAGEDPRAIRERAIPARSITGNLAAWRQYTKAMACTERLAFAGSFGPCLAEMEKAVELDPAFALAWLQISQLRFLDGRPRALQKAALTEARRHPDRVPPHERLKLQGWSAFLDGRDVEAKALFREAAEASPDDKHAWYLAGEIPYHRDEFAEALPFFRRVHALDPLWWDASQHLSLSLGATGDLVGLRALGAELAALGSRPEALLGLCYAQLWYDAATAIASCERARTAGAGPSGDEKLAIALLHVGPREDLVRLVGRMVERDGPLGFGWYMSLWLLGQEGRWPGVRERIDAGASGEGGARVDPEDAWFHSTIAELVLGSGDLDAAWRESLRVLELDRALLSNLAVHFAYQGDMKRAAELREYLPASSPRVEIYDALVLWRAGDPAGAVDTLRRVAASSPLSAEPSTPPPLFLLGEALSDAGRHAEAIDALRRFQRLPLLVPTWFVPRSQFLLARSLERSGDLEGARAAIGPLLRLWSQADPGQPLLADARALGARVGAR